MTGGQVDRVEPAPGSAEDEAPVAAVVEAVVDPVPGIELSEDPGQAVGLLLGELAAARAAEEAAVDKWKRAAAEFDNYRRRARRDRAELVSRSSERVAGRLLPVLDSLDSALLLDVEAGASSDAGIREGLSGTRDLLLSILAAEGLAPIEAVGSVFDPALHEAVQIGEGEGAMVVAAELRRGYMLGDRVIRAALVVVGYRPSEAPEEAEASEEAEEDQGSEGSE